jgi:hypothetical protein
LEFELWLWLARVMERMVAALLMGGRVRSGNLLAREALLSPRAAQVELLACLPARLVLRVLLTVGSMLRLGVSIWAQLLPMATQTISGIMGDVRFLGHQIGNRGDLTIMAGVMVVVISIVVVATTVGTTMRQTFEETRSQSSTRFKRVW